MITSLFGLFKNELFRFEKHSTEEGGCQQDWSLSTVREYCIMETITANGGKLYDRNELCSDLAYTADRTAGH